MNNIDTNLSKLISTVKAAKGKSVSELSPIEAHAVAFFCGVYPVELVSGKLKYKKTASEVALSVSFVWANSFIRARVLDKETGFVANSAHFFYDIELPEFKEASILECLDAYPEQLLIPNKPATGYETLPRIKKPARNKPSNHTAEIVKMLANITIDQIYEVPQSEQASFVIKELSMSEGTQKFLNLISSFVPFISQTLDLTVETCKVKRINYTDEFDIGKGPLVTVMYWASQGIYLNSRTVE